MVLRVFQTFPDGVSNACSDKTADNGSRGWRAHSCTYKGSCAESNRTTGPGAQRNQSHSGYLDREESILDWMKTRAFHAASLKPYYSYDLSGLAEPWSEASGRATIELDKF